MSNDKTLADVQPGGRVRLGTPGARWAATGEPDPHGTRYDCERAALVMGDLSDDELANAVFLHGNEQPTMAQMAAGAMLPIAYLTAAKDRIRWLSRALIAAEAKNDAQPSPGGQGEGVSISDDDRAVLQRLQDALPTAGINGWAKGVDVLERLLRESLAARQPVGDQHPDDLAVDAFAAAMKAKMAEARAKGRGGWEDPAQCTADDLSRMLRDHVEKGDTRDVANFCMMLHQRGEAIADRQPVGEPVADDWHLRGYAYASKQATTCAGCGKHKHTPLRIDAMGGHVCLTCIDHKLGALLGEFGYPTAQAVDLGPLWVSVNDRLPSEEDYGESGDVVVRYRYNTPNSVQGSWDVGESRHDADDIEWNNGWLFGSCDYAEVSHWMPKHALLALIDSLVVGNG